MSNPFLAVSKNLVPPLLFKAVFNVYKFVQLQGWKKADEKDALWYDKAFDVRRFLQSHYTQTSHYFLFSIIADRIIRSGAAAVLDIGCGSGQLARLLGDRGLKTYTGFDFSEKRIAHARAQCPDFDFVVADAFTTDLYTTKDYDAVICNEFLEHVNRDKDILEKIPSRKKFYGAVPNYSLKNHVRFFHCPEDVHNRYQPFFSELRVDQLLREPQGKRFYLLEATTR